jgi:hypothetical protein
MNKFETMTETEVLAYLDTNAQKLSPKDLIFATDLSTSVKTSRYPASPKQLYWLRILASRCEKQDRKKVSIGSLSGIMALFNKASAHLKRPAVVLDSSDQTLRLTVAGAEARVPGSINVSSSGSYEDRTWFGRILSSGEFEASPRVETPESVITTLRRFSADPAGIASAHGRKTGQCCFCARPLTDGRSVSVGYGPICADRFGLPWGVAEAA